MEQKDHFVGIEMVSLLTTRLELHATCPLFYFVACTVVLQLVDIAHHLSPIVGCIMQFSTYADICPHIRVLRQSGIPSQVRAITSIVDPQKRECLAQNCRIRHAADRGGVQEDFECQDWQPRDSFRPHFGSQQGGRSWYQHRHPVSTQTQYPFRMWPAVLVLYVLQSNFIIVLCTWQFAERWRC